ncbi:unnamed protein product, partial [Urochloa humidicola]
PPPPPPPPGPAAGTCVEALGAREAGCTCGPRHPDPNPRRQPASPSCPPGLALRPMRRQERRPVGAAQQASSGGCGLGDEIRLG